MYDKAKVGAFKKLLEASCVVELTVKACNFGLYANDGLQRPAIPFGDLCSNNEQSQVCKLKFTFLIIFLKICSFFG